MTDLPRVNSLCSGMGGGSLGLLQAGYEVEKGIDISKDAISTFNKYIGGAVHQDLADYYPTRHDFEVLIIGGTPCDQFSRANKKRNIYGKKSQLVLDYCRVVKAMQPEAFIFENVIHLSRWAEAALLEMPGYKVTKNIVDCSDYGVPQQRRRKIFVGTLAKAVKLCPVTREKVTVRQAFDVIPENWGFVKHRPETIEKFRHVQNTSWVNLGGKSSYAGTIRLQWDQPSLGIGNVKKFRILHPDEDRSITIAEALALQGFPPSYIPVGTDTSKAIQVADAIPPPLSRNIGIQLKEVLMN